MKAFRFFSVALACAVMAVACKQPEPVIETSLKVSPETATFNANSPADASITVTANKAWTASSSASWLTLSATSGEGDARITLKATENVGPAGEAAEARTAEVTFASEDKTAVVKVSQKAETIVFVVDKTEAQVPADGASVVISVEYNTPYEVTIPAEATWITKGATKATTTANVTLSVAANDVAVAREATVTLTPASGSAKTVKITQAAAEIRKVTSIKTAEDFAAFAKAEYEAGETVTLEADITLPDATASYIVDTLVANFDGGKHTITYNITSTVPATEAVNVGLFGVVTGKITDLKVAGSIKFSAEAGSGTYGIGGIAGRANAATIENCESSVNILADTKVTHHMGGILGDAYENTLVKNCVNNGKVEMIIPELGASNASQLGGIIGHIEANGAIEGCTNNGQISYAGTGTPRIGGMCGYINVVVKAAFTDCTNNGAIVWTEGDYTGSAYSYVGGISGYFGTASEGAVVDYTRCKNTGDITLGIKESDANSRVRCGGIACHGGNTKVSSMNWNLKDCENTGNISCTSVTGTRTQIGGFIGHTETSCVVTIDGGKVECTLDSKGGGYVGGVIASGCAATSSINNVEVTEKTVLNSEKGFTKVGILAGNNTAYTTKQSGKVAGTINNGVVETKLTSENYKLYLFGNAAADADVTEVLFGGTDTPDEPVVAGYIDVATAAELLAALRDSTVCAAKDTIIRFTADIDLKDSVFTATVPSFKGTLDGQGHSIKNWAWAAQLINVNMGTVKGIVIDKTCSMTNLAKTNTSFLVIENCGTIDGCINNADINLADITGTSNLGTIVGKQTTVPTAKIINCVNNGNYISPDGGIALTGQALWGGIIGRLDVGTVENCGNTGDLTVKVKSTAANQYYGGVVGFFDNTTKDPVVIGCYNKGKVIMEGVEASKPANVGGVLGASKVNATGTANATAVHYGTMKDCWNEGEVRMQMQVKSGGSSYSNVGGVAGYLEGSMIGCYATETASAANVNPATDLSYCKTAAAVGGVCGRLVFSATDCYNRGSVKITGTHCDGTANKAFVGGSQATCIGGCFGAIGGTTLTSDVMTNCKNYSSNISVAGLSMKAGNASGTCIGGVAGFQTNTASGCENYGDLIISGNQQKTVNLGGVAGINRGTLTNCVNKGTISHETPLSSADACSPDNSYTATIIGGIAGKSDLAATAAEEIIKGCTNEGAVKLLAQRHTTVFSYVGGICGQANNVLNCINKAEVSSTAATNVRVAGISGSGSGTYKSNTNEGAIKMSNATADLRTYGSAAAGILGHTGCDLIDCSNAGAITLAECADSVVVGFLVGTTGATTHVWDGDVAGGSIVAPANVKCGWLLGGQLNINTTATDGTVTVNTLTIGGTSPLKIAATATINGTAATAADLADKTKLVGYLENADAFVVSEGGVTIQ